MESFTLPGAFLSVLGSVFRFPVANWLRLSVGCGSYFFVDDVVVDSLVIADDGTTVETLLFGAELVKPLLELVELPRDWDFAFAFGISLVWTRNPATL